MQSKMHASQQLETLAQPHAILFLSFFMNAGRRAELVSTITPANYSNFAIQQDSASHSSSSSPITPGSLLSFCKQNILDHQINNSSIQFNSVSPILAPPKSKQSTFSKPQWRPGHSDHNDHPPFKNTHSLARAPHSQYLAIPLMQRNIRKARPATRRYLGYFILRSFFTVI